MNTLSHLPWYRSTTLPASAHVAMQCAQILAKLDSEGLGLRDTDEYSYTPPVRGQCPSLDGADLTPDELTGEDVAATMSELFYIADPMADLDAAIARTQATPSYYLGVSGHNEQRRSCLSADGGGCHGGQTASVQAGARASEEASTTTTAEEQEREQAAFVHYDRTPLADIGTSEAVEDAVFDGAVLPDWRVPAPALALGLSDHALYLIGLLSRQSALDANGWCPLCRDYRGEDGPKGLDATLGKTTVNGQRVSRATVLLGSLARGGEKKPRDAREGELIARGIVERYPIYSPKSGMAQLYRLKDQSWVTGPHEYVDLVMCPSGRAKGATGAKGGEEVPSHLGTSYRGHSLDVSAAVRDVMAAAYAAAAAEHDRLLDLPKRTKVQAARVIELAGLTLPADLDYNDYSALRTAVDGLGELPNPALIGRRGRPSKNECKDLRERFGHALSHIKTNYVAASPAKHKLSRAHGRLFSPFVGLWSELRPHVRLNGERLVELDIRNAQPLLIANRMIGEGHGDVPDVRHFADLCQSGKIYEYAHNRLNGHDLDAEVDATDRDRMKVGFYSGWMFCSQAGMNLSAFGEVMKADFPTVDAWVREQKPTVKGDDKAYARFACACQRYESTLMVDALAVVFGREGIDVLTVHDASYVRESQASEARRLLESEVLASLPVKPIVVEKPVS